MQYPAENTELYITQTQYLTKSFRGGFIIAHKIKLSRRRNSSLGILRSLIQKTESIFIYVFTSMKDFSLCHLKALLFSSASVYAVFTFWGFFPHICVILFPIKISSAIKITPHAGLPKH